MQKSLKKMEEMKENMASGVYNKYTKKERLLIDREITRLERFFGGIKTLNECSRCSFHNRHEKRSGRSTRGKCQKSSVVGIVDSNSDPDSIDYPNSNE